MFPIVILGLASGGLYALSAIGIVCIYRGSRVLNLALGGIAAWAAYLFVWLRDTKHVQGGLATAAVLVMAAVAGVLIYTLFIRPIRSSTELLKIVMTLGLLSVLSGSLILVFGSQPKFVESSLPTTRITLLKADVGLDKLLIVLIAAALAGALALWSRRSRIALATRAMADNEPGITALGFSPHVLGAFNWALGSVLAALAGILLCPIVGLSPGSIQLIVVPALSAALFGRFINYGSAFAGGLAIGVLESLATRYISAPGWGFAVPFILVLISLVVRRETGANRARIERAMPIAREFIAGDVGLLVGLAAIVAFGSSEWTNSVNVSMCFGIMALSLVIIVGYMNQISLGQMTIAALSALICVLYVPDSVPFVFVPLIAGIVGAVVGFVNAVPVLRLTGVNLAVVTIGAGVALSQVLFTRAGGVAGYLIPSPDLFGTSILSISHPRRYGFFVLFWLALSAAAVIGLRRSGLGRQLLALRTNERVAAGLGVNVAQSKTLAFSIASGIVSVGGLLLVTQLPVVTFGAGWDYTDSINLVVSTMLAGVTAARGGIFAGALVIGGLSFTLLTHVSWISTHYTFVSGILLMLTVLTNPRGATFIPERKKRRGTSTDYSNVLDRIAGVPLVVDDVSVVFGGVHAVSNVSLQVQPGEIVGIIGPNGAGKTTLLDAICGFARASGAMSLGGVELGSMPTHRRIKAGISRVFQGTELFDDLTVAQNLAVPRDAGHLSGIPAAARDWMELTGISDDLDKRPDALSLGRRKMIGIARALMTNPKVLLLDEPGAGLGHSERGMLADAVRKMASEHGLGIAIIDHDMPLVLSTCQRICVLVNGRVAAYGTPTEILAHPDVRSAYLGQTTPSV